LGARIVNDADDFVICCRGTGEQAMVAMRGMTGRLLKRRSTKKRPGVAESHRNTSILGYTFGRCDSARTGRAYIGTRPAQKSIRKVCLTVSEETSRLWLLNTAEDRVAALNRVLVEWANDFPLGPGQQRLPYGGPPRDRAAAPVARQRQEAPTPGVGAPHATPTSTSMRYRGCNGYRQCVPVRA